VVRTATATTPGCGQYCQEAGESAGQSVFGYPCPKPAPGKFIGCLPCPKEGCMTLYDSRAVVSDGAFSVQVRCNLTSEPCVGAFLACDPDKFCFGTRPPGPQPSYGGRLAGSDFEVAAGQRTDITVGLTALGEQLVARPNGYHASVLVSLKNHALVVPATPSAPGVPTFTYLTLTSRGP
jgi:hypothetical protein